VLPFLKNGGVPELDAKIKHRLKYAQSYSTKKTTHFCIVLR